MGSGWGKGIGRGRGRGSGCGRGRGRGRGRGSGWSRNTLVKVYVDQATVAVVTPQGKKWEEKEKLWGPILETLT